jgi:hypothetical protein
MTLNGLARHLRNVPVMRLLKLTSVALLTLSLTACGGGSTEEGELGAADGGPGAGPDAAVVDDSVCSFCGHGTCDPSAAEIICKCDDGWSGASCEQLLPPPSGDSLYLWLDGDDPHGDGSTKELGALKLWTDKSQYGANFGALKGYVPSLVAEGDRTVVEFSGGEYLKSSFYDGFDGPYDYTIYMVVAIDGENLPNALFAATEPVDENGKHAVYIEATADNDARFVHRAPFASSGGSDVATEDSNLTAGDYHLIVARQSEGVGVHSITVDGVTESVETNLIDPESDTHLTIGRLSYDRAERYLDGRIAEVLIYGTDLETNVTSPMPDEVIDYLNAKWSLWR